MCIFSSLLPTLSIAVHFTVYVALTLLMYIRKRYAPGVTPDQLIEAIQRTGLDLLNRKYMTWPMLKETIAKSKSR